MAHVPILVKAQSVLVVGGGNVALRKIKNLLALGGDISIVCVAKSVRPEIRALCGNRLSAFERDFSADDVDGRDLVFACTDDHALNSGIARLCNEKRILLNEAASPERSDFFVPSSFSEGDITVSVSTNGRSPGAARKIKEKIRILLAQSLENAGDAVRILGEKRKEILSHGGSVCENAEYNALLDDLLS